MKKLKIRELDSKNLRIVVIGKRKIFEMTAVRDIFSGGLSGWEHLCLECGKIELKCECKIPIFKLEFKSLNLVKIQLNLYHCPSIEFVNIKLCESCARPLDMENVKELSQIEVDRCLTPYLHKSDIV